MPQVIPDESRAAVQGYNEDDCRSTEALRDWLERQRAALVQQGHDIPRPEAKGAAASKHVSDLVGRQEAMRARLLAGLAPEASQTGHPDHPRWLLACKRPANAVLTADAGCPESRSSRRD